MGILGRRRTLNPPETNTDGTELLARQLASPDPALRLLAEEAEILAFDAKNAAPSTLIPFSAAHIIKTRRNAGAERPPNPDPKRLRWDPEKRAFRVINPTCVGGHGKSVLTGESLTCGLCAGRGARPKRFQPGLREFVCRYCGRVGQGSICTRCEKIRSGFDIAHMSRHSIAERRGWTGPPTIRDDELWITIIRRLRDADHRRLVLDEKDARKAARARRRVKGAAEEFEEAAE
jgi:hypothetical protein